MKAHSLVAVSLGTLALASLTLSGPVAGAAPSPHANYHATRLCDPAGLPADVASCHAEVLVDASGKPVDPSVTTTGGMTPTDLRSAYGLNGLSSGGRTVAIVDAYGYPNAASDLAVFRSKYGLPACTVANGCLTIVNQRGSTTGLPRYNSGWAGEQALDLDAVSSVCPDCKIVLVQTDTASIANLGAGVNTAAKMAGVVAISNSYGGGDLSDATYGSYYKHPGIAITASTGDNGYQGASYPASSSYVTAVGGTSLNQASNARGWTETVWSGAGSGCSTSNVAPAGQTSTLTACGKRAMADVSAVADPKTGLLIYGPNTHGSGSSWAQYGGTSLSAPIIAGVYALAGRNDANTGVYAALSSADVLWGEQANSRVG